MLIFFLKLVQKTVLLEFVELLHSKQAQVDWPLGLIRLSLSHQLLFLWLLCDRLKWLRLCHRFSLNFRLLNIFLNSKLLDFLLPLSSHGFLLALK